MLIIARMTLFVNTFRKYFAKSAPKLDFSLSICYNSNRISHSGSARSTLSVYAYPTFLCMTCDKFQASCRPWFPAYNFIPNTEGYRSGHNEAVLKTVCLHGRVSSNLTPSAKFPWKSSIFKGFFFFCCYWFCKALYAFFAAVREFCEKSESLKLLTPQGFTNFALKKCENFFSYSLKIAQLRLCAKVFSAYS